MAHLDLHLGIRPSCKPRNPDNSPQGCTPLLDTAPNSLCLAIFPLFPNRPSLTSLYIDGPPSEEAVILIPCGQLFIPLVSAQGLPPPGSL